MARPGWAFLPALGGAVAHAPFLRYDLLPALKRPLDEPLFGANKTIRGALAMAGGTAAATFVLHRLPAYRERLPEELRAAGRCVTAHCSEPRSSSASCPTARSSGASA